MNRTTRNALTRFAIAAAASVAAASIWAAGLPEPGYLTPDLGQDYEFTFAQTRFSLRVENEAKGMHYTIGYGGQSYHYVLGPFDATRTSVRAVADFDGDALPDFVVDVDEATYLLLSTQALPGANLPAAELLAGGC